MKKAGYDTPIRCVFPRPSHAKQANNRADATDERFFMPSSGRSQSEI
ncbi:MAG: hypothetical protein LBR95_03845 [Azoarcus sp.]|jgi:hypothetical protein|nr:hypothetical protein [Azoarcus sp.]